MTLPRFKRPRTPRTRVAQSRVRFVRAILLAALTGLSPAFAHDPGLSTAQAQVLEQRLIVELTYAPADLQTLWALDIDGDGSVSAGEWESGRSGLEANAGDWLEATANDRRLAPASFNSGFSGPEEGDNIHLRFEFPLDDRTPSRVSLRSLSLRRLPLGHRQYLQFLDGRGDVLGESLLSAESDEFRVSLGEATHRSGSFGEFFLLGVEHILSGYDHLLFLFALLIVGLGLLDSLKTITAFTLAHSVTLGLATLRVVDIPSSVVEPLIAASIVYVGFENLWGRGFKRRWMVTFAFGLVHGLGFASVLRELGVGSGPGGIIAPLLSFNLGVEAGQIAVAALILPLVWTLYRKPAQAAPYAATGSVAVILAGGYWLLERTLL